MPSEIFRVTQDLSRAEGESATMRDLNRLTTELNKVLSEVGITLGKMRSQDGAVAKYAGDVDLDGHNLINVNQIKLLSLHKKARAFTVIHNDTTERDKIDCHPQYAQVNQLANLVSITDLLPDQSTHAGEFLETDGTNISWQPVVTAGSGWSVLTNGDTDAPEPIYASGDAIMTEICGGSVCP